MKRHCLVLSLFLMLSTSLTAAYYDGDKSIDDKVFIIKGDNNYPPHEFINDKGEPDGFNVELFRLIAKEMGISYQIELGEWGNVWKDFTGGKADMLLGAVVTPNRSTNIKYSFAHSILTSGIFTRKGTKIRTIDQLGNKEVIVQNQDFIHYYLIEHKITNKIIHVKDPLEALRLLASGKHDAAWIGEIQGMYFINKYHIRNLTMGASGVLPREYCYVTTKENEELLGLVNVGLLKVKESGEYDKIYNKWFRVHERINFFKKYRPLFAGLIISFILLSSFTLLLRNRVKAKTKELEKKNSEARALLDELQLENEYRSKVEANLKESQRELNSILDSTPDLIWSISVNNLQLVKWNNSFGKFIMNEMHIPVRTGMNLEDLFPNDKQQQAIWHEIYKQVLNNEAYECEFRSASGKVYLQIYSRTLKKNGVVTGVSMFAHDITLKKLAERQQQQIQLITERLVNVLIFQTTVGDDGKERFTFLSHSTEHLFGCTIDEAYSDASLVFNKIHPEDFSRISSEVRHSFSEGVPLSTISRVINSEGDTVWLSIYSRPRQSDGIRYWDGIMTDITELKKIEEELILAKEKAEESDRLKTAFLHNISHEIRTPMNSILGFSDLLDSDDTTQEQRSLYTRMISENSFILMNIVNKVIEVSSIQTGQLEVINDNVDIKELIVSVFKAIRLNLRKSSVKIQHNINISDEDNHIRSDIYKLKEILTNLMDNAVKFTKEGVVEIGCSRRGDYIEFYVQDTGIGIPEKMQGEIFNSFTQVERGDIREYGGTGLGLTISKAYVEILGGEIWLDSQEGKGSTFFFTIPIIQNQ